MTSEEGNLGCFLHSEGFNIVTVNHQSGLPMDLETFVARATIQLNETFDVLICPMPRGAVDNVKGSSKFVMS